MGRSPLRAETGTAQNARATRANWLAARQHELLPTRYAHVVFTLPHLLSPLALQNKKVIYGLLFRASAETLLDIACDLKHLGADIGFFSVLHTSLGRSNRGCAARPKGNRPSGKAGELSSYPFTLLRQILARCTTRSL